MRPNLGGFDLFAYALGLLQIINVTLSLRSKQGKRGYTFEILSLHFLSVQEMCFTEILLAHDAAAINYEFTGRLALHYIMFFDGKVRDIRDVTALYYHFGTLLYLTLHVPAFARDYFDLTNRRGVICHLADPDHLIIASLLSHPGTHLRPCNILKAMFKVLHHARISCLLRIDGSCSQVNDSLCLRMNKCDGACWRRQGLVRNLYLDASLTQLI